MKNAVTPLLNELFDTETHQREIINDLTDLVNSADKNAQVLAALENCRKAIDAQDEVFQQLFRAFEQAAYSNAVHHFNL